MEGGSGADGSGDGVGAQHPLGRPGGVGGGDGGHIVHHVAVVILRHQPKADLCNAVAARHPAAQGLGFVGLHGHHADVVGPALDGLAHPGDGAAAAHPNGDGIHDAGALPGNGLGNGGACHPAVVGGVVVVGQPVHVEPALFRRRLGRQRPRPGQTVPGRGVEDLCPQPQQILLPQGGGILRHGQHHGVPRRLARQRQRKGERSARGLDDGLAGLQRAPGVGQRQHPFGQVVPGSAGGTIVVQVGVQPPPQPAGGKIPPQLHDGAGL